MVIDSIDHEIDQQVPDMNSAIVRSKRSFATAKTNFSEIKWVFFARLQHSRSGLSDGSEVGRMNPARWYSVA